MNNPQKKAFAEFLNREGVRHAISVEPELGDRRDEPTYIVAWEFTNGSRMIMGIEPDGYSHT